MWPKYFGGDLYEILKEYLGDMIRVSTQQKYDESVQEIIVVLRDDPEKLPCIHGYYEHPERFAGFVIDSIPGSLERWGSQHSEANHAVVVAALGTGSSQKMVFEISQHFTQTSERLAKYRNKDSRYRFQCEAGNERDDALPILLQQAYHKWWLPTKMKADNYTCT
jgi:hypothetical protein